LRNEPDVEWREIVGVVGAVHDDGPDRDPVGLVFWPQVQDGFWGNSVFTQASMAYVIRSAGTRPSALVDAMRDAVREVNPNLPMANVTTLRDLVRQSTARTEFTVLMLAIAAAVAVLLGVVGLYGVVSYAVATRTREIGVRMALGARGDEVARMVVGQGARLAALGLAVGVVVALMTSRLLSALLYGVEVVDLPTYAVTASLLGAVALLASYLPARRAARVEPTEALRHE